MKLSGDQFLGYARDQIQKAKDDDDPIARVNALGSQVSAVKKSFDAGEESFDVEIYAGPSGSETFDLQEAAFSADGEPRLTAKGIGVTGQGVASNLDELQKSLADLLASVANDSDDDSWPADMNAE